ncbi:MAG TPA: GNAT family protein [Paludibacter sp.]|nr:GNAT family protein [Paludibacter sp.]
MSEPRVIVVDANIRLKEIELEDTEVIFNTIINERDYLGEWLPFVELTRDISFTRCFVEGYLNSDKKNLTCAIFYQNQFVGIIGLKDTDFNNKKTEIGYWLSEPYQHKGIITNSCKSLINFIFDKMNINRVQIKVAEGNMKSQRIPKRLGFKREGIERDGELHSWGFVDLVIFSLLKADR